MSETRDLSVIVPTHNRATTLKATLEAMSTLDSRALSWELIVVDNASSDSTGEVIEAFTSRLPIVHLREPVPGKNRANNLAIGHARGEILVFTDDDVTPSADWLNAIQGAADRWPEHRVFGGRILPVFPERTSRAVQGARFSAFVFGIHDRGPDERAYPCGESPGGGNCWFRRSVFDEGLRYHEEIGPSGSGRVSGSELELFTRLSQRGEPFVYVPDSVVQHRIQEHQTTLRYLLRRAFASGRGHARIHRPGPEATSWFGIPRYDYRLAVECAARCGLRGLTFDRRRALEEAMQLSVHLGHACECRGARGDTAVGPLQKMERCDEPVFHPDSQREELSQSVE